jgi:hypothetical protein
MDGEVKIGNRNDLTIRVIFHSRAPILQSVVRGRYLVDRLLVL